MKRFNNFLKPFNDAPTQVLYINYSRLKCHIGRIYYKDMDGYGFCLNRVTWLRKECDEYRFVENSLTLLYKQGIDFKRYGCFL